jgi:hypothetical protein
LAAADSLTFTAAELDEARADLAAFCKNRRTPLVLQPGIVT